MHFILPSSALSRPIRHSLKRSQAAFSLVEILVVVVIVSIMSALAVAGLGSASATSQTNKAMSNIGGMVDFSRQYAIAHNTYTYVAFSQVGEVLTAAIFASRTGRPLFESVTYYPEDAAEITIIAPPREITQMTLADNGTTYGGWTPPAPPGPASGPNRNWSITSQEKTYDAMVVFTPVGAATVSSGGVLDEVIEFGLLPLSGDGKKGFAMRISGLTGLNRLLRP